MFTGKQKGDPCIFKGNFVVSHSFVTEENKSSAFDNREIFSAIR